MLKLVILGLLSPILLFSGNLDNLIEMSLKNKKVMSFQMNTESIQEKYESIKKEYLPNISVGGDYTKVSEETAATADSSSKAYVNLFYNIYDGGKKNLTYKSYESKIEGSKEDLISLKNLVSLDVINHYFNYLTYISQKDAKLKEIEQLDAQYQRLRKFFDAGTTTIDELDKIISRLERANLQLQELNLKIQTVLHRLEYITGQKVSINNGSYIEIAENEVELKNNIKSLKHLMQTKLLEAQNVKTNNNIKIDLNNTYTYYDNNFKNESYAANDIDKQNVFSINLKWNLFDFNSTKTAYNAAYKSFLSSKSTYEYEKNKADVDLNLAKESYTIAKLKIKAAEASLKAANSTYDVTKNKYENGLIDNVAYLEALSDKSRAESSLAAAKYGLEISKANLMYQKGKNVWEYVR